VLENTLNIDGSEWVIIIFVALVLVLGTNKLPEAAKKFGKVINEFNKAKNEIQTQVKDVTNTNLEISGPVENERKKIEAISKTLGVDPTNKTDEELRSIISSKMEPPESEKKN